jgi:hypothetical protein
MHRNRWRAARYPHKGDSREFQVERAYSLCVGADRYAGGLLSRMPRPPLEFVALLEISAIPLALSAATKSDTRIHSSDVRFYPNNRHRLAQPATSAQCGKPNAQNAET